MTYIFLFMSVCVFVYVFICNSRVSNRKYEEKKRFLFTFWLISNTFHDVYLSVCVRVCVCVEIDVSLRE